MLQNKKIIHFIKSLNQNAPLSGRYKYPYKPILLIAILANIKDFQILFNQNIFINENSPILKTYYDLITNSEELTRLIGSHKSKEKWQIGFNLNVRKQVLSNLISNPAKKLMQVNNNFWFCDTKKRCIRINIELNDEYQYHQLYNILWNEAFICLKKCMPEYKNKTHEEILNYSECLMSQIYTDSQYIKTVTQTRKYQYIYAKLVKDRDQKCKICCLDLPELLHACHIKPYTNCNNDIERYDENNGITLCCNHHKLFDSGYFTFTKEWKVKISPLLTTGDQDLLIKTFEPCYLEITKIFAFGNKYINYHNDYVFIKN